jgi:uncharacterized protein
MDPPDTEWPCLAVHPDGVVLSLKVSPNASRTQARGIWQNRLRLRVQAPPVEGKANEAIRDWAARFFGVRRQDVSIARGERSSEKVLLIRGTSLISARAALAASADV